MSPVWFFAVSDYLHPQRFLNFRANQQLEDTWILGTRYLQIPNSSSQNYKTEIYKHIAKLPFFCYRYDLKNTWLLDSPENNESLIVHDLESDIGWGCMIRSAQSMLATAIEKSIEDTETKNILKYFVDEVDALFSIYEFGQYNWQYSKISPGQFTTPSSIAKSIYEICHQHKESPLEVYYNEKSHEIFEDEVVDKLKSQPDNPKPVLVLIVTMLGTDKFNPYFYNSLLDCFSFAQSVGIVGGHRSSSYFYYGCSSSGLLYLDPHCSKKAVEAKDLKIDQTLIKFRSDLLNIMPVKDVDTSMLIGFVFRSMESWNSFRNEVAAQDQKVIRICSKSRDVSTGTLDFNAFSMPSESSDAE